MEAERVAALPRQAPPVGQGRIEQYRGADHIGLDEGARPVDRAVDMGLGGKMDDRVRLPGLEDVAHARTVGDVGADEVVARIVGDGGQRIEIAGVSQLVDHHHLMRAWQR